MLNEVQIRQRKSNLLRAIEHENEDISKLMKDINDSKERIQSYQSALKEINIILNDSEE